MRTILTVSPASGLPPLACAIARPDDIINAAPTASVIFMFESFMCLSPAGWNTAWNSTGSGPPPPSGMTPGGFVAIETAGVSGGGQAVVLELLAQLQLLDLAGGRVRDLVDEDDVVRDLPLGDAAVEETEDVRRRALHIRLAHDDEQRPLVPLRMPARDGRRLVHRRMRHRDVLEV